MATPTLPAGIVHTKENFALVFPIVVEVDIFTDVIDSKQRMFDKNKKPEHVMPGDLFYKLTDKKGVIYRRENNEFANHIRYSVHTK